MFEIIVGPHNSGRTFIACCNTALLSQQHPVHFASDELSPDSLRGRIKACMLPWKPEHVTFVGEKEISSFLSNLQVSRPEAVVIDCVRPISAQQLEVIAKSSSRVILFLQEARGRPGVPQGSSWIAEQATRIFSIRRDGDTIRMHCRKSRDGEKEEERVFQFPPDYLSYFRGPQEES